MAIVSIGKDVEQWNAHSQLREGDVNWYQHFRKQFALFNKIDTMHILRLSNSMPRHIPSILSAHVLQEIKRKFAAQIKMSVGSRVNK